MSIASFSRLESLSNEILLDIFEYIDAYNLYKSLYGLNYRINTLLLAANLHMLYDSSTDDQVASDTIKTFANPSQFHILSCYKNINIDEQFLTLVNENLRCVRLHQMNGQSIINILEHLPVLNRIKSLSIFGNECFRDQNNLTIIDALLIKNAGSLTSLVNLSLRTNYYSSVFPQVSVQFLQLRRLSLNNYGWSQSFLQFLHDSTPNLKSLKFIGYYSLWTESDVHLKQVDELHMNSFYDRNTLQVLLRTFPSLRRLHIDDANKRSSQVIHGTQWQQAIEQCLPHLKQFTLDFGTGAHEDFARTFLTGDFWFKKKTNVKMVVNKARSRYRMLKTISFGQPWQFRYFENLI